MNLKKSIPKERIIIQSCLKNIITENYNAIGALAGLILKNKSKITVGYTGKTDFLNPTRDRGTFTVAGSISF